MSVEVFRLVILGMYAVGAAIVAYYEEKTKGFSHGYDEGYTVGYMVGEFKALCRLAEHDMDKDGDTE